MANPTSPQKSLRQAERLQKYCASVDDVLRAAQDAPESPPQFPELGGCTYSVAWIGPCGVGEQDRCADHAAVVCVSCGNPAVQECAHTMGAFVCGFPLCARCEHDPKAPTAPLHQPRP